MYRRIGVDGSKCYLVPLLVAAQISNRYAHCAGVWSIALGVMHEMFESRN